MALQVTQATNTLAAASWIPTAAIICACLLLFLVAILLTLKKLMPGGEGRIPGPPRLPLVGSYPFMHLPYRPWLSEATRLYGHLFAFQLAGQTWVSLNTFETIHNALSVHAEALSGRPRGLWSKKIFRGSGLVLGEGPVWKKHRKFVLKMFREVSFRKLNLESMIQEELHQCLGEIEKDNFVSSEFFSSITSNVTYRMIFGLRATDNKEEFDKHLRAVQTIVQKDVYATFATAVLMPLFLVFPALLFYLVKEVRAAQRSIETLLSFIEERIEETYRAYNSESKTAFEPGAFVEAVVDRKGLSSQGDFCKRKLAVTVFDLLIGGTDTTSSCLKWTFLHLATRPAYQEHLASVVLSTLGSRQATFNDCRHLPELLALISEVQRLHPPLPTAINHRVKSDITICGYVIPRNTWVFPNLRAAHRDPRVFASPDEFLPERFLTPEGNFRLQPQLIPFSMGSRSCPGKHLAQMEIELVAAELIRRYRFRLKESDAGRASFDLMSSTEGVVSAPLPYSLVFEPRCM